MKRYTLIDKAFLLKRNPLFGQLDLDLLLPIADKLSLAHFDKDDLIFDLQEEAHRMYFIVKGTVLITDEEGKELAHLAGEDFFGDEALFNDKPRQYGARCIEDTFLLSLSKTNLLTIISECPSVAVGLLQSYTKATPFRTRL